MYFSYNEKTKTAIIPLKVKAGAKESTIHGFIDLDGTHILKISVKAAPEDGKANNAIIKMLADKWDLKQNQLEIVKGVRHEVVLKSCFRMFAGNHPCHWMNLGI